MNAAGFTENISPTGLHVTINRLEEVGSEIWLKVFWDHNHHEVIKGVVVWRLKAPPEYQMAVRHGLGIKIAQASEQWYWLLYEMSEREEPQDEAVRPHTANSM